MSKVVLITGGSSGIGKSIGEFLTEKGFTVYGTSRTPENYTDSKFKLVQLDVSDTTSIQNAIQAIIKETGRLDVVINNAGAGITGPIEEIPEAEIKRNFETNFFGPISQFNSNSISRVKLKSDFSPFAFSRFIYRMRIFMI